MTIYELLHKAEIKLAKMFKRGAINREDYETIDILLSELTDVIAKAEEKEILNASDR